jgi:predicted metal-dependent enzyme (double-stranded beta helix superfamily)
VTAQRTADALLSPPLEGLVRDVRGVVARHLPARRTAEAVAALLRPVLGVPGLLTAEQREGDPDRYRQHLLHVEPDGAFSVVALVWLPGQSTTIHDHVSWCTVGVHEGCESETRYRLTGPEVRSRLVETGRCVNRPGEVSAVAPPGDIHRVANAGPGTAISLHVYGADVRALGSSIRRTYDHGA